MQTKAFVAFFISAAACANSFAFGTSFAPTSDNVLPRTYSFAPLDPSVSQWNLETARTVASVFTTIKTGSRVDPVTGIETPIFSSRTGKADYGAEFMEAHAQAIDQQNDVYPTADVGIVSGGRSGASMSATFNAGREPNKTMVTYLTASERSFRLAAGDSVTFSGFASFNMPDYVGQIVATNTFDNRAFTAPFASVSLGDLAHVVSTSLGIRLNQQIISVNTFFSLADALDYAADASTGFMSISVKNSSESMLSGTFFASSSFSGWSSVSTVPEPAAYASMLLGLAIVGGAARRMKKADQALTA